ncbi:hypothetical protein EP331_14365 [bacterium]|nr:MAG: hypothetical protein EP331_14365 [bacterium]
MKVFNNSILRITMINLILFGIICLISPKEVERSKWLSYEEWLESVKADEANTEASDSQNDVQITQFSWADYHQSQTAKQSILQPDNGFKLALTNYIGAVSTPVEMLPLYQAHKPHHQTLEDGHDFEPLAFGVVIGAP